MVSADWASCTYHVASQHAGLQKDPKCDGIHMYLLGSFVFEHCDSSSGITNLRHTYGTI